MKTIRGLQQVSHHYAKYVHNIFVIAVFLDNTLFIVNPEHDVARPEILNI